MSGGLVISHDLADLDFATTSALVKASYWGGDRTDELNMRAFSNSVCAIAMIDGHQVGFGRASGDKTLFARVSDVIVWTEHRGKGVGKAIMRSFLEHPDLATVRVWSLNTADAHGLYGRFGFFPVDGNTLELRR
jgi:predicted N-acetyltransferase YhbS